MAKQSLVVKNNNKKYKQRKKKKKKKKDRKRTLCKSIIQLNILKQILSCKFLNNKIIIILILLFKHL